MIEDRASKIEGVNVMEEVKVLEVLKGGYLKKKREFLEPTHDRRNSRKNSSY